MVNVKLISTVVSILVIFGVSVGFSDSSRAIQIISPSNNGLLQLELNELKKILEADEIKDRNIAIISIAGPLRTGKSFLLNFFLRYLYAQYKDHNVFNWIEGKSNGELNGFKWRSGRKPETIGIWSWSEIFTCDLENGEKVAIILLDTQGLFDYKSRVKDYSQVFALSMMLSSVTCFNIMQNIQEDHLQHLELFTGYGRYALDQSTHKPFQELMFIVRDWRFPYETSYGLHKEEEVKRLLDGDDSNQVTEIRQRREDIFHSFDEISAFMMPSPGNIVSETKNFTGNLQQISPEFIKYVEELVPALFAPNNLRLKKINGEKIRARDLVQFANKYIEIFNEDKLPDPSTVFGEMVKTYNLIIHQDCMNFYTNSMQKSFEHVESYIRKSKLMELHQSTKDSTINQVDQFQNKQLLGGQNIASELLQDLIKEIDEKFEYFKNENIRKREHYIEHHIIHYGYLTIRIIKASAQTHASGNHCDIFDACDAYVRLFINGNPVYRTRTVWNDYYPYFDETYTSSKMRKKAPILIEMWDEDMLSSSDLMLSQNTDIDELLSEGSEHTFYGQGNRNNVVVSSIWVDEPIELDD